MEASEVAKAVDAISLWPEFALRARPLSPIRICSFGSWMNNQHRGEGGSDKPLGGRHAPNGSNAEISIRWLHLRAGEN